MYYPRKVGKSKNGSEASFQKWGLGFLKRVPANVYRHLFSDNSERALGISALLEQSDFYTTYMTAQFIFHQIIPIGQVV